MAIVHPHEGGEGLGQGAGAVVVGLDGAVAQAQGSRGVGVLGLAEDLEPRLGDAPALLGDDAGDFVFHLLADGAVEGIQLSRQYDHGIRTGGQGCLAALGQLLAQGGITQLSAAHRRLGHGLGALASQHGLHVGMISAQLRPSRSQPFGQQSLVDGFLGRTG